MEWEEINQALVRAGARDPLQLLFGDEAPEQRREAILASAAHRTLLEEIKREGELLLQSRMPELTYSLFRLYADTGSRAEYEKVYFERRRYLTTFGQLAWLEPQNRVYAEALLDALWSVCGEYTWCLPAHMTDDPLTIDLFAAETAYALAEVAALNRALLPPLLERRIRGEVQRRVLSPFISGEVRHWERAAHNWASVCGGSVGAAALYMLTDPGELSAVLQRVLPAMEAYLSGFGEDGACTEGYLYWQYGFGFYVYFADLLASRTGGAIDLFAQDKVREIARFQQKSFLSGRKVVNFSDSLPELGIFMGLSEYLLGRYDGIEMPDSRLRAAYTDDHCSRWAPAVRNLLWFRGEQPGGPWGTASYYLADAEWLVSRYLPAGGGISCAFAAKGGHNAEPHNHNDLGQFMLMVDGEALLADLGSGQYTRDYFGPQRYEILCNGSQGHSVPEVNGRRQRPGAEARAQVLEREQGAREEIFALDLTSAYDVEELQEFQRRFVWKKQKQPRLELHDRFLFAGPGGTVVEQFMSWRKPEPAGAGRLLLTGGSGSDAALFIEWDEAALGWEAVELVHLDHFGREVPCWAIRFTPQEPAQTGAVEWSFAFQCGRTLS